MDYKYIEQLLQRYWQCLTTLEEERILRTFFQQDDVPAHLLQWKQWFTYPQHEQSNITLGSDFEQRMIELTHEPPVVKARTTSLRRRLRPLTRAAAVVAVVLTIGNAIQISLNKQQTTNNRQQTTEQNTQMAKNDSINTDTIQTIPFTEIIHIR